MLLWEIKLNWCHAQDGNLTKERIMKANEITRLREAKEKPRKQYTSSTEVIADIDSASYAEQGKSAAKFSSKNIRNFANPRAEAAFKISELSMLIKNNDELSLFLDKVADMVSDESKALGKPIMAIASAALKKHKTLSLKTDPDADPVDDDDEDMGTPSDDDIARQADQMAKGK